MPVVDGKVVDCGTCGHLACICPTVAKHLPDCRFRIAVACPIGIECDHGYDVCPTCDLCTCPKEDT